jgi:hypothetical protein
MPHGARRRAFLTVVLDLSTNTPTPTSTPATVKIYTYRTQWGSYGSIPERRVLT